jgi:hypothetical protein
MIFNMEPQVWVPWLIAALAPVAVLLSQWLNNRDRGADRAATKEARESDRRDYWRAERLKAHSGLLVVLEGERMGWLLYASGSSTTQPAEVLNSLTPQIIPALAAVRLLSSASTFAVAQQAVSTVNELLRYVADVTEMDDTARSGIESRCTELARVSGLYARSAALELGTA